MTAEEAARRPIRIAFVTDAWLAGGGGERMLSALVDGLDRERFAPQVCVLYGDEPSAHAAAAQRAGVPVHFFNMSVRRGPLAAAALARLVGLLRRERIDVVHGSADRGIGGLAGRLAGVPKRVYTVHDLDFWRAFGSRAAGRLALERVYTHVVAVSAEVARGLKDDYGVDVERLAVIHNGVDPRALDGEERAAGDEGADDARSWAEAGGPLVVSVARLIPEKALDSLLEALPAVIEGVPDVRVAVVGEGPLRTDLETYADLLGVSGTVRFLGLRDDVGWWLRHAAAFVLPSRREGLGIAALEAMSFGVPVVVTDAGGLREVVSDGETGLVVHRDDEREDDAVADGLAVALVRVLTDDDLSRRLGAAGRCEVEERFSSRHMVAAYEDLYQRADAPRGAAKERPAGLRVLMLVARPGVRSPLPELVPVLVEALRDAGCEVDTEYWSSRRDGESLPEKLGGRLVDLMRVRRRLRERRYEVLFVTTSHDWRALARDVPLTLATRRSGLARIIQFHGSMSDRLGQPGQAAFTALSRWLVRRWDAVLVLSSQERREWEAAAGALPVYVVSNPAVMEAPAAASDPTAARDHSGREPFVLLYVGRLLEPKGALDLVRGFARLSTKNEVRLVIAGEGPEATRIRAMANELGVGERVELTGYLDGARLSEAYRSADVLVLPSHREGFPMVFLEAMAHGLPIVTTAIRGALDHLENGENAVFVPVGDAEALADGVARLLGDEALRRRMGENNRRKVEEYRPERIVGDYLRVIETVSGHAVRAGDE